MHNTIYKCILIQGTVHFENLSRFGNSIQNKIRNKEKAHTKYHMEWKHQPEIFWARTTLENFKNIW